MTLVRYKKLTTGSTVVGIAKFCPNIMGPLFTPGGTFSYCKALKFLNNIKQNHALCGSDVYCIKDESLETLLTLFGLLVAKNICKKEKKRSQNMLHNSQQPLLSKPVKSIQYLNFDLDFQNNKVSYFWKFYLSTIVDSQKNIMGKK